MLPFALTVMLAVFCAAGAALYVSSAGSASIGEQLAESCRSTTGLTLPVPRDSSDAEAIVAGLGASLPFVDVPRSGATASTELIDEQGTPRRLRLMQLDGLGEHVTAPFAALALGEVALSATNAELLHLAVGDEITLAAGGALVVGRVYDDIALAPIPDAWCGLEYLIAPNPAGDPPPPSALASRETVRLVAGDDPNLYEFVEYRLTTDSVTLTDVAATHAAFERAVAGWNTAFADAPYRMTLETELDTVLSRGTAVRDTVARSLAPVRVASLLSIACVLIAATVLLGRERRRELRLLAMRGEHPARIALAFTPSLLAAALPAGVLGFASAWLTVTHFGPSALLETHAIRSAVLAATACVLAGVMLAATTIGVLADRSVDHPTRHVHARFLLPLGCLTLCALTLWSFRRLDTVGGIRTYGVQARGGDMLALGFPLSLLLAVTAATALVLRAAITHARLSGGRLPRALRLGWRRVVLEAGPTVATVAAAALAAGSMITATALADGARDQLHDKAAVYVGSDLAVTLFDEPVLSPSLASRATLAWTTTADWADGRVELWGVDRATFAAATALRDDGSELPLADLIALLEPTVGTPAPAIVVGGDLAVGEEANIQVAGTDQPLRIAVVATARFFPGKTSGSAQVVVDRSVVIAGAPYATRKLLVREPPTGLVDSLRASGVRTGVVLSSATTFDASNFSGLRWAYRPLATLGLLFASMAMAVQLLVIAARRETRRASHLVMRRTGFTRSALWRAALVETLLPPLLGVTVGIGAAVGAAALAVVRLDPMPLLAPPAQFSMPWPTVVAIIVAVPVWAVVVAGLIVRTTLHSDPMRTMRGEQ